MMWRVIGMVVLRTAVAEVTRGIVRDAYDTSKFKLKGVISRKDSEQISIVEIMLEEGE